MTVARLLVLIVTTVQRLNGDGVYYVVVDVREAGTLGRRCDRVPHRVHPSIAGFRARAAWLQVPPREKPEWWRGGTLREELTRENYFATCRSRSSSSVLQSMQRVAVGLASSRLRPISTPQLSQ
jgi:hypothetical protein